MTQRCAVLLVVCAVVGAVVGLPAVAAQETATPTETNDSDGDGLGTQLTAFTQSSSAAANDSVENGMWQAGFEQSNASERARLVTDRTGGLEARLERLQAENESIQAQYENGTLSRQAYVARQSRLDARIDALRTAVNDTDEAATEAGVNDTRLERLKQNASQLSGPEVAGVARGLGGGPTEMPSQAANQTGDRGSPTDAGNVTATGDSTANDSERPDGQGQENGPASENTERAGGDTAGNDSPNGGNGDRGNGGQRGN